MANLLSQNIGTNYKSILNLDTTINTPLDTTLRAVTDGMGNASPLQLSTEQVGISRTVALSAGATNPRLFNEVYTINNSGAQTGTLTGLFLNATETALNGMSHNLMDLQVGGVSRFLVNSFGGIEVSGAYGITFKNSTVLRASINSNLLITNFLGNDFNRIQLGGTTSSFPSLQRNLASISFRLADDSGYCNARLKQLRFENASVINDFNDGTITVSNNAQNDFNRLQLGGTTNAFPSIKRNGAAIDFRLADDSAACNLNAATFSGTGIVCLSSGGVGIAQISNVTTYGFHMSRNFVVSWGNNTQLDGSLDTAIARYSANVVRISNASTGAGNLFVGGSTGYDSSAILQADSTTKGFLMPRMTTTQKNAIASPATGLMVFDTDLGKLCVFSTTWQTVTSL